MDIELNDDAKRLDIKKNNVKRLQSALERTRAARNLMMRLDTAGVDCEGREGECAVAIEMAEAYLKAVINDPV